LLTGAVWWGVALLVVTGAWTAAEAVWLWRTVRVALDQTTVEARAPGALSQLPGPRLAQRHANQLAREARYGSGPVIPEGVYE
jgi:hypothetical protein